MVLGSESEHGCLSSDSNKLSYEIFSLLENNFLFGYDCQKELIHKKSTSGKVRILSIDGGGVQGIVAGRTLAYLEEVLQKKTGNPDARIADFFDVAIGTGIGGLIAAMLFANNGSGRPLCRAEEVWRLLAEERRKMFKPKSEGILAKFRRKGTCFSGKSMERVLKHLFAGKNGRSLTLKDTLKPILIPCYDLSSAAPFLFSRADALETDHFDFRLWEVCRAAIAAPGLFKPVFLKSVDGLTACTAIDGGLVMNNPTAAAITHVLHNKQEFPSVGGVEDLLVLSVGTGQFDRAYDYEKVKRWGAARWANPVIKIVGDGISDTVDHAMSMAFGAQSRRNYVRIQGCGSMDKLMGDAEDPSEETMKMLMNFADSMLKQKSMETLPFGGKRKLSFSNAERLDWLAEQVVGEHQSRVSRSIPTVVMKQVTPRNSVTHSAGLAGQMGTVR